MIYFDTIRNISEYVGLCKECWIIVRSMKNPIQVKGINCIQVQDLSPSWDLFSKFRKLKESGNWNNDSFTKIYRPQFMKEMSSTSSQYWLKRLRDSEDNILCVCYCQDESCCHRFLIKEILKFNQVEVN